jgi:predicted lipoprotein with Yx(FWY)xxD motif
MRTSSKSQPALREQGAYHRRRRVGAAVLVAAGGLVIATTLAACGTSSSGGGTNAGSSAVNTSLGPPGTVGAARTNLGTVLVDSHGRTLYELSVDSAQHIVCAGYCASLWPPDTVPAGTMAHAGGGVEATLTTVKRPDGTWQLVADGHPLYTYGGDGAAGQTKGQGVKDNGGTWHALTPGGAPLTSGGGGRY